MYKHGRNRQHGSNQDLEKLFQQVVAHEFILCAIQFRDCIVKKGTVSNLFTWKSLNHVVILMQFTSRG